MKSAFVVGLFSCCLATSVAAQTPTQRASDIDGDHHSDMVLYRPSNGDWSVLKSGTSYTSSTVVNWGGSNYVPVPGDYDGDGKMDYGVYEPTTGVWLILKSTNNYSYSGGMSVSWGGEGYVPVPADYDGDNKTDPAVYVQATGMWYALKSSTNFATSLTLSWGGLAYTPVPGGDYDGDGKADGALYYVPNSTWYVLLSGASYTTSLSKTLGGADKALVPGDYDGDGKTDFVVYNTTTGQWSGYKSESNYTTTINVSWGGTGYAPVPSDFDGDGRIDIGVYRAANTTWSVLKSSSNYGATLGAVFGTASDSPVAPFPLLIGADHATGIDSPAPNSSTNQPFTITGWALDYPATSGTGVDAIQVLAYPNPGSGEPPITITNVITGLQRSDVAAAYGTSYQNSGFVANISRLQARAYRFVVLTHASSTNTWYTGRSVTINVGSEPYLGLSYPIPQHVTQPFTVSGWALDAAAAPPGTGVNQVKLQAYPNPGSGQPPIEHDATYGLSQPAAPSFFGQQFANSGFSYTFNTLPPGTYLIFVSAHSTVSNSFSVSDSFTVDVDTPVAPLTVSHVSDEYNAPITVSLSTATAGAAISYTLNGGALTPYTGSFTVSQPSALTASASLTGYVPATASRQYSFKVATPTLSQAPGTYPGTITLTIEQTTTPDATIYWTYNGSDPDPLTGAHEYSGAITIQPGTSKTIKARAIRTGWTPSEIVGGVYTADYSGPITISAQVSPRPNAAGWNNTNVTVSFTCVNATVCPSPIVISHDTAAEIVTGTATNFDHSATSPPITLRIDRTPPQLTLTSPGGSTTTNLTSVAVAGTTTDTLSGVASIWCNGSPSSVTGSPLCNVQLAAGPNSVTLSVMDAAGNSATAGARVTRTGTASQLRILPGVRTMLPAEQRRLAGRDEYGQIVPNVSWTSSDSAVGTVDANGVITAVAVGTATITASLGSLTAQLTLHVVAPNAEGEVPAGAIRWSLSPTAVTSVPTALFIANSAATESVEVFGTETDTASGQNIIRALGADGEELWREASPVNWELGVQVGFADVFGGLVGIAQGTQSIPPSLLRVGGNDDIAPWRYVSPASFLGKPIQSLQGTIFLPEFTQHADGGQEAQLAAIDGSTGQFLFRLPIPSRVSVTRDDGTPNPPVVISGIPWPAVDAAGNAYVEYYNSDESQHYEGTTLVNVQKTSSVNLLIVRPDSTYSSYEVEHEVYNGPPNGAIPVVSSVEIIPDAVGGVVAVSDHISASSKVQRHLNRIANGTVLQHQVDDEDHVAVTSKEGPLFLQNVFGESVAAVDPVGGGELWRVSDPNYQMLPIAALAGGHVLVLESTLDQSESRIVDVDSSGAITMTQTVDLQQNLTPVSLYNDGVVGVDSTGNITEVALPTYLERTYASFNAGQVGPRPIRIVTFIPDVQGTGNLGTRANGDPYIIKDYVTEVREIARVRRGIVDRFYVGRDPDAAHGIDKDASPATSVAFRAVLRQNIDGLVFLGDSVYTPEPSVAVGLRFFDKSLITSARRDVIDDVDKLLPPGMPPQHSMYVDRMRTSAQVLFLATCFVGSDFKTWWNINEQSTQQAMIVPAITAFTDLAKAAGHWQGVEQYLVSGTYLDEAIRQLNVFYNVTYKAIGAADGRAMVWR